LIAKLYYGTEWSQGNLALEKEKCGNRYDAYFLREMENCQHLGKGLFHEFEAAQIHFT
jgi:hypothetical protein